jgi:hypothetical protein
MMILGQFLESTVVTWTCFILSSMIRCVSHIDAIGLNINCKSARDPNVWNFCEFEASLVGIDEFSVTSISQRWQRLIVHSMLQLFAWTLPESGCWYCQVYLFVGLIIYSSFLCAGLLLRLTLCMLDQLNHFGISSGMHAQTNDSPVPFGPCSTLL